MIRGATAARRLGARDLAAPVHGGPAPGLYVHVPFCKTKCPYCDFYSITAGNAGRALARGARERGGALLAALFGTFDTLYVGGGTPSLLSEAGDCASLRESSRPAFDFAADTEITIEANPDDVTRRDARGLARSRHQSREPRRAIVRRRGASVPAATARRGAAHAALALHPEAGFANIGIDLIYGFEGQSLDELGAHARARSRVRARASLLLSDDDRALDRIRRECSRRDRSPRIDEETQRDVLHGNVRDADARAATFTTRFRTSRARRDLISRHNHKYWSHVPYLGLGPSAHSFHDGTRWWNVRSVGRTARRSSREKAPSRIRRRWRTTSSRSKRSTSASGRSEGVALDDLRRYRRLGARAGRPCSGNRS